MSSLIGLDDREHATVLAALRHWQARHAAGEIYNVVPILDETDIATKGGTIKPLSVAEMDALCDRLNLAEAHDGGS